MRMLSAVSIVIGALFSINSFAADGAVYNSGSCSYEHDVGVFKNGNIYNGSTSVVMKAKCYATKDQISHSIESGWFEVKDQSNIGDVSCSLRSRYNNIGGSGGGLYSSTKKTSGFSNLWQLLEFGELDAETNGHYYYSCLLPATTSFGSSWLGAYKVREYE